MAIDSSSKPIIHRENYAETGANDGDGDENSEWEEEEEEEEEGEVEMDEDDIDQAMFNGNYDQVNN